MKAIIDFLRPNEYFKEVILFSSLGLLFTKSFSFLFLPLLIANLALMAFAFTFNDIEDSKEDKRKHSKRNPISRGRLGKASAYIISFGLLLVSILIYFMIGTLVFPIFGTIAIFLFLYSWKSIRLKSKPFSDVLIHGIGFGAFPLTGYLIIKPFDTTIFLLTSATTMISIIGELLNEIRDYNADLKSKFKTTVIIFGKNHSKTSIIFLAISVGLIFSYLFYTTLSFNFFVPWLIAFCGVAAFLFLPSLKLKSSEMFKFLHKRANAIYMFFLISGLIHYFL